MAVARGRPEVIILYSPLICSCKNYELGAHGDGKTKLAGWGNGATPVFPRYVETDGEG